MKRKVKKCNFSVELLGKHDEFEDLKHNRLGNVYKIGDRDVNKILEEEGIFIQSPVRIPLKNATYEARIPTHPKIKGDSIYALKHKFTIKNFSNNPSKPNWQLFIYHHKTHSFRNELAYKYIMSRMTESEKEGIAKVSYKLLNEVGCIIKNLVNDENRYKKDSIKLRKYTYQTLKEWENEKKQAGDTV